MTIHTIPQILDTTTTTPPKTTLDEARLKQPSIRSLLLPKGVGIQNVTSPPTNTSSSDKINTFDEHGSTPAPRIPLIQEVTVDGSQCSNAGGNQGTDVGTPSSRNTSSPVTPSLVERTTPSSLEPCSYKRGGMCNIHNKVGTRSIIQTKSWKKKKDGSFGYVTSKKVSYSCESDGLRKIVVPSCIISETDGGPNNGSNSDAVLGLSSDLEIELTDRNMSESLPPD